MNKIKTLLNKYKEMLLYLVFGVLTTVVNYVVYFGCKAAGVGYKPATVIAWVLAVAFAYVTNRIWVFESKNSGFKGISKEIALFVSARLFSLILELIIMYIGMDLCKAGEYILDISSHILPFGELITKTIAQFVIIISNYVFSKCIIFRAKRQS